MAAKVVTAQQMRTVEEKAAQLGVPPSTLMDFAGRAVAEAVAEVARGLRQKAVLVLVGPGNNGGDGLVAARYLREWGFPTTCYAWHRRAEGDRVRELALRAGVAVIPAETDGNGDRLREEIRRAGTVVDALLGTGLARPLSDELRGILAVVRQERGRRRLVAVDLPTGINSDTGAADEATLAADLTVTLGHTKAGLVLSPGARFAGRVLRADIGLPPDAEVEGVAEVLDDEAVAALLPPRPACSHKGSFGKALVAAGSAHYVGAAALACESAYRVGAGLVTLAVARGLHQVMAAKLTETTFLPLGAEGADALAADALPALLDSAAGYDALLVGPGLGRRPGTTEFVRGLARGIAERSRTAGRVPFLVLDADALNALAEADGWWQGLGPQAVVTPHPGEMARLLGKSVRELEENRLETARRAALQWGLVVILKGAYTVVAAPDGRLFVNPVAVPSLATAGSGDVLAGALVGLGAQGMSALDAAKAAVYLHGLAGEALAARLGEAGAVASDLLPLLPDRMRRLRRLADGFIIGD